MQVELTATTDHGTLDALSELIHKRALALRQTTEDATIATAINVLTSLKAATKSAPKKGNRKMYTLSLESGLQASWARVNGKKRRVVRSGGHINWSVTNMCRNLAGQHYVEGEVVHVYKAQLLNELCKKNVYYAMAKSESQVRKYIEDTEHVTLRRLLSKERGMAKYAIGIAQAKVSNRPMTAERPSGSKQWQIAYNASIIRSGIEQSETEEDGVKTAFWLDYEDKLKYSVAALRGGDAAFEMALKKAANKTAGLIRMAFVNKRFDQDCPTPFPEAKGVKIR